MSNKFDADSLLFSELLAERKDAFGSAEAANSYVNRLLKEQIQLKDKTGIYSNDSFKKDYLQEYVTGESDDALDAFQYAYAQHYPKYPKEKDDMANNFLPFVVSSSTPVNIFKTLISRSKGMNRMLVASIFNLTLNKPINELRELANSLDKMPLDQLYEEMMQRYELHRADITTMNYFEKVAAYFPEGTWWDKEKLKDFTTKDVMMFFYCTSLHDPDSNEYSYIDFSQIHVYKTILENFKSHVNFNDEAKKIYFKNKSDLLAFVVYAGSVMDQMEPDGDFPVSVCAEFLNDKPQ